jgi:hypothetical protein
MTSKLTKAQQGAFDLMLAGWELGVSKSLGGRCWLQKGGVGKGGESKTIRSDWVTIFRDSGRIVLVEQGYPVDKYKAVPDKNVQALTLTK